MLTGCVLWGLRYWGVHTLLAQLLRQPVPIVIVGTAYGFLCMVRPGADAAVWTGNLLQADFLLSLGIFLLCAVVSGMLFFRMELR